MRIFGYRIPFTRDLQMEVELLQQREASLQEHEASGLKTIRALHDEQYALRGELDALQRNITERKALCADLEQQLRAAGD